MVSVVQLVEHQVVILGVAGSSPVTHPTGQGDRDALLTTNGNCSPADARMSPSPPEPAVR